MGESFKTAPQVLEKTQSFSYLWSPSPFVSGCEWGINTQPKWVGSLEQALGSIEPYKNSDINFRPWHQEWLVIFLRHRESRRFCIFISCRAKITFINYLPRLRELFRPSPLTGIISTRNMIKFAFREGQFFVAGGEFIASLRLRLRTEWSGHINCAKTRPGIQRMQDVFCDVLMFLCIVFWNL